MNTESIPLLPDPLIYGFLALGAVLILVRPYWAFLLGVFLPIGVDSRTMVFSRLSGLGQYFNMADACMCVCFAAMAADCIVRRRRLSFPIIVIALISVLFIGFANATIDFGYSYESLRSLRWALNVPLYYLIASNLVVSEERARQLLIVAIVGAVAAESQHIQMVMTKLDASIGNEGALRTTAFMFAHSESWLVAGPFLVNGRMRAWWIQVPIAMLFLVGNVMHQTRSVVIAAGIAGFFYYGWLLPGRFADKLRRFQIVLAAIALGLLVAIPQMGLGGFTQSYSDRIEKTSSEDQSTKGRQLAIDMELGDWMDGNVIIGRGLGYFFVREFAEGRFNEDIAYGHIGYATYLSQLGLLGVVVHGIWFPVSTILLAKRVRRKAVLRPSTLHLASLSGTIFLYCTFVFALSGSFLAPHVLPGILAGFLAATERKDFVFGKTTARESSSVRNAQTLA